jgi:hypothetical protein
LNTTRSVSPGFSGTSISPREVPANFARTACSPAAPQAPQSICSWASPKWMLSVDSPSASASACQRRVIGTMVLLRPELRSRSDTTQAAEPGWTGAVSASPGSGTISADDGSWLRILNAQESLQAIHRYDCLNSRLAKQNETIE